MTMERGSYDDPGTDPMGTDEGGPLVDPIVTADDTTTTGTGFAGGTTSGAGGGLDTAGTAGLGTGSAAGATAGSSRSSGSSYGGSAAGATSPGRSSSGQGSGDKLADAATGVMEHAGETVGKQAQDRVGGQMERGATMLHHVADAVRKAGDELRDDQPQVAGLADTAAERVDGVARYLRDHEAQDVIGEVEDMARRQPALFLGGAFVLGAIAARFLKASPDGGGSQRRSHDGSNRQGSGYGGSGYGGTGYGGAGYGSTGYGSLASGSTISDSYEGGAYGGSSRASAGGGFATGRERDPR